MPSIATIIITKNEAHNIEACINSVLWTDEIIIVDAHSTDGTQDICRKFEPQVKLYIMDWPGYGAQKNRAMKLATTEWLLFLDADERVTPELRQEIELKLKKTESSISVYRIPRQNYFLGKALKYCRGKGERQSARLVRNGKCNFSLDLVHETIQTEGSSANLRQCLNHFSYNSLENRIEKMNFYSSLGALKLVQCDAKSSFGKALLKALWAFVRTYFLRLGCFDGWPGFIIALSNFEGTFYKYAKVVEHRMVHKPSETNQFSKKPSSS